MSETQPSAYRFDSSIGIRTNHALAAYAQELVKTNWSTALELGKRDAILLAQHSRIVRRYDTSVIIPSHLRFSSRLVDVVFYRDPTNHMNYRELSDFSGEVHRVLRPGGFYFDVYQEGARDLYAFIDVMARNRFVVSRIPYPESALYVVKFEKV